MPQLLHYSLLRNLSKSVNLILVFVMASMMNLMANDPIEIEAQDSLYSQWNVNKNTLPVLFVEVNDFNNELERTDTERLMSRYGVGGILVGNGDIAVIRQWIDQLYKSDHAPIFIADLQQIFELPFAQVDFLPKRPSVELFREDSLVYELGSVHGKMLRDMGFSAVRLGDIPVKYTSQDFNKVAFYLSALKKQGLKFYLQDDQQYLLLDQRNIFEWDDIAVMRFGNTLEGKKGKRVLKKFRNKTGSKTLLVRAMDGNSDISQVIQGMRMGLGVVEISSAEPNLQLVQQMMSPDVLNQRFFKRAVKSYFRTKQSLPSVVKIQQWREYDQLNYFLKFRNKDLLLVNDNKQYVPFTDLDRPFFTISDDHLAFQHRVDQYRIADHLSLEVLSQYSDSLEVVIVPKSTVIIDLTGVNNQLYFNELIAVIEQINSNIVVLYTGNVDFLINIPNTIPVLWSPSSSPNTVTALVQAAFGALAVDAQLPIYIEADQTRRGAVRSSLGRLRYDDPQYVGVSASALDKIDLLVDSAITEQMFPGCQIMMIKDGAVIYDRSFGYMTYDSVTAVQDNHIYDIASVTKVTATVPAMMWQVELGNVKLDDVLGNYLSSYKDTDKSSIAISNLLMHQSGLKSYIPFWRHAKFDVSSQELLYKKKRSRRRFTYQAISWSDSIQSWIQQSDRNSLKNDDGGYRYLYSDLGFMLLKDIVESKSDVLFDQYLDSLLYTPLGMRFTLFNPLTTYPKSQIAPTEQDDAFRHQLLQGEVHDKNTALLGGVSGHAGLFANANDLGKYLQMLMNGGDYGGVHYFDSTTINLFATKQKNSCRRALGWDKPDHSVGNASQYASMAAFGHSGFTGTLVWVDPTYDLIYIFLSNRIYPDPQNYKLIQSNTRTKIHDLMYESFLPKSQIKNE